MKSNPQGDYRELYGVIDEMYKRANMGGKPCETASGTFAFAEYGHSPPGSLVSVKSGEFTSVVARRNLKAIADTNWTFNRDAQERFLLGQFYRFLWNGDKYALSAEQAKVVDLLLHRLANETPESHAITESEILTTLFGKSKSPPETLAAVFNDGQHPAWNRLIQTDTDAQQKVFSLMPLNVENAEQSEH